MKIHWKKKDLLKTFNKIILNQAKKIAEDFIKEKKLLRSEGIKLIKISNEKSDSNNRMMYYLLYEDQEEFTKKVFIGVKTDTKRVEDFSVDVKASIDYMRR